MCLYFGTQCRSVTDLCTVARFSSSSWFMLWSGSLITGSLMLSSSLLPWSRATSMSSWENTGTSFISQNKWKSRKEKFVSEMGIPSFCPSSWCACLAGWLLSWFHWGVQFLPALSQMTGGSVLFSSLSTRIPQWPEAHRINWDFPNEVFLLR